MGSLRRFAALGLLWLVAPACGRTKPGSQPATADAAFEHVSIDAADATDATDTSAVNDLAEVSEVFGANDVHEANDVAGASDATDGAEAGCIGADARTQDPFGRDCCEGLVIMQSTTNGAFVYTCSHCVEEGQLTLNTMGRDCCPGLRYTVRGSFLNGSCLGGIDPPGVCSRCGNGTCEDWELPCGCPEDCGASCGGSRCPVGSYCLQTPGAAGGFPMFRCVDVASDCPAGVFSCQCGSAKSACPTACGADRLTAACF